MHSPTARPRSGAVLAALAAALVVAFVLAPAPLAAGGSGGFADQAQLTAAFREAFTGYWRAGGHDFTPGLERVVDYWFRYHVAKAVIAALLLAVLVALGVVLWKAYQRSGGAAVTSAGAAVAMLALFALVVVMANVQGAAAPFASLLPMLVDGPADGELAGALDQIRQRLAASQTAPALDVVIDDYARYHTVMAIVAAFVALLLIGASVLTWRRFARTGPGRTRRAVAAFGVLSALSAVAVLVVAVANTTVAADPLPGLTGFFDGGW